MNSIYIPVIVALIAGPVTVLITNRVSRPKVKADATKTLTDISLSLVQPLRDRVVKLEQHTKLQDKAIADLEVKNAALERWAQLLWTRSVERGDDPPTLDQSERLYRDGHHPGVT